MENFQGPRIGQISIIIIALLLVLGGILFFSIGRLGVGYVALIVDPVLGTTSTIGDGQSARYYFKTPWSIVHTIFVATDNVDMWTEDGSIGDYPAVKVLSNDGLEVEVDISVRWTLSPSHVFELYTNYPNKDWKSQAIIPIIRETIRNTIVNYTAIQTIENRTAISIEMREALGEAFITENSLANAVVFEALNLREMMLPTTFVNAIEEKLAAEQNAIAAEFNKTRILVEANASAQSKILEARGRAESRIIISNATREAIDAIVLDNQEYDIEEITHLYLYLETLSDISELGKGRIIFITRDGDQTLIPIR
jgi:regulator of protease activity HflC (stomatin/prohibitin superfamily)